MGSDADRRDGVEESKLALPGELLDGGGQGRRGERPGGDDDVFRTPGVAAVASVVWGWGVAQWPYLLPTSLTIEAGAAPHGTLVALVVVTVAAVVLVGPSLVLLYVLDQRNALELDDSAASGDHGREPATSTGN